MASPIGSEPAGAARLPFQLRRVGTNGRLALTGATVLGWVHVDRLELEVPEPDAGFDAAAVPERYQRRRTGLVVAALRVDPRAIDARIAAATPALGLQGMTAVTARIVDRSPENNGTPRGDGYVSVTARVADGLAAAEVSFRVVVAPSGLGVRVVATDARVHGHLPTPAPVLAHRILATVLGAPERPEHRESDDGRDGLPWVRGLGDIELEPLPALLWQLLPPHGWRLPSISGVELVAVRITRAGIAVSYAPHGQRSVEDPNGEAGGEVVAPEVSQLVLAHDAMHSADELLRRGQLDDAMRGYRALLAAGGPDQPQLLARILAIAAARPPWFVDGSELARQALSRWPEYGPAHAALASIALAKGDSRDAAAHLGMLAEACGDAGDDDAAALAALAAARLLRVLDPRGATALYELALSHHPGHVEAVDALVERYTEEGRWQDLVRLHRARLAVTTDRSRAVHTHLRLADVLAARLGDRRAARAELERARELAADELAVHQALAELAESAEDGVEAAAALGEVARLARERRDHRTEGQAWARRAALLERAGDSAGADAAWVEALEASGDDLEVMRGAARARGRRGDAAGAAALWRRVLDGEPVPAAAAQAALELGRALAQLGDEAGARAALDSAAHGPAETAADAHQLLAELYARRPAADPIGAAAELDAAILSLVAAAEEAFGGPLTFADDETQDLGGEGERMLGRAAQLALERARLLDGAGDPDSAAADLRRAHRLAGQRAPEVARDAARALLDRTSADATAQREWIDALLATRPPELERARLLVRRAQLRLSETPVAPDAALADLTEALTFSSTERVGSGAAWTDVRADALATQARILAEHGDHRGSASALTERARLARERIARAAAEADAAAAWLAADEPAAALPHSVRAAAALTGEADRTLPAELRRRILETLAEAAWRQRAWNDVARATASLLAEPGLVDAAQAATLRFRGAVAAEKLGDAETARRELESVVVDDQAPGEIKSHAHRLLAELCERAGDLPRAARSLEAFAADPTTGTSASARADAWYRAAELYRRSGGEGGEVSLDDAARCLEGALRLVEDHLPALDALELVERALGNLERVAVILGRKIAASARRPARQKALLARLAALQIDLARPEVALEAYRRALEIDPDYRPALRFVADQARAAGDRSDAAALYERLAGPLPGDGDDDAGEVLAARVGAANAFGQMVVAACAGDAADVGWAASWLGRARDAVEVVLEIAPHDSDLRQTADAITGNGEASPAAPSPVSVTARTRAAALQRQGGEARDAGRLDIAAQHLTAAIELDPRDPELVRDLAEVLADQGDWAAHADTLAQLSEIANEARGHATRRADVLLELADVAYDRLGDVPRAREAMRAAAEAHGPGARRDATLRILATEAFSRGDFGDALSAYEAIVPSRRTATDLVAMATAHHRLGRDTTAIVMLEEARATGQLSDEGAMLLFALHTERKRKADLAAALEHAAGGAPVPEARARLLEALTLYRDHVVDGDAATRVQDRLSKLEEQVQDAAAAALDASAAMAAAMRAFVGSPEAPAPPPTRGRTVDDSWSAPNIVVTGAAAADAADVAAQATSAAAPMSRAVELEAAAADAAVRGDRALAADLLGEALDARIAADATTEEALGVVGNLETVADAPDHVVRVLFAAAARAPSPIAIALLRRAAAVAEHGIGDDVIAADALARAHSLALDDTALLDELVVLLQRTGDVIRLADACERTARATGGRTAARAFYQLGLVHRDAFKDARRSAEDFAAAHRADPDFPDVWLPLAGALAADDDLAGARALYERALASDALSDDDRTWAQARLDALGHDPDIVSGEIEPQAVMAAVAQTLTDMMTAVATGITESVAAAVAGELPTFGGDQGAAASEAPEAPDAQDASADADADARSDEAERAERPTIPPLFPQPRVGTEDEPAEPVPPLSPEELEHIYERAGDWDALSELLGQRIVATSDRRVRAALWHRRGRLYRDVLHREAETYRCLREAHACDPDDPEIAHALRSVAIARGEWALAAQLLYREIAAAPTDRDRGALHLELAMIFDEKLLEADQARINYEQALALDPAIPAAPRPLATIYELAARYREAALMWERAAEVARAAERPPLLLRAAAASARAGNPPDAHRLAETAALAADAVGDAVTARDARAELTRLAPGGARAAEVAAAPTDDEQVTTLETALVDAQARSDGETADRHATSLLDLDPSNGLAFRHLAGQAEHRGDWPMLTALLTARAMVIGDPAERASLWFEIGRVHELHRDDLRAAAAAYDRALEADPDHPGALDARATLAFRDEDWERAEALYARILPGRSSLSRELILLRRVAIAEHRGRLGDALAIAREAAAAEDASRDAFAAAVKLGVRLGDYAAAAVAARAALELIPRDDAAILDARLELADLLRMADDPDAAVALYALVLAEDPRNLRALSSLADLQQQRGHPADAARALRTLVGIADLPARRAELVWRLGELYLRTGDVDDADDAFLRASDLDPGHLPTLRRLLDVYWRCDEPSSILDVASDLAQQNQLLVPESDRVTLARALVATAATAALHLSARIAGHLGADAAGLIATVLAEITPDHSEISVEAAVSGLRELARKGNGPRLAEIVAALADVAGLDEERSDAIAAALTG